MSRVMHDPNYPPSTEYLARQAGLQKELERVRERLTWTDAQILAERDAVYVEKQRSWVLPRIAAIEREMEDDNDGEGYIRKYYTDEG